MKSHTALVSERRTYYRRASYGNFVVFPFIAFLFSYTKRGRRGEILHHTQNKGIINSV